MFRRAPDAGFGDSTAAEAPARRLAWINFLRAGSSGPATLWPSRSSSCEALRNGDSPSTSDSSFISDLVKVTWVETCYVKFALCAAMRNAQPRAKFRYRSESDSAP